MLPATGALILPSFLIILPSFLIILLLAGVDALEVLTAGVVGLMLAVAGELTEKFPHRWYCYLWGPPPWPAFLRPAMSPGR